MDYEIIVGLEVHAELSTKTKIYCSCKNEFGSEVNSNCCPICTGMPGTLPTLNEKVVEYAVKMGHATNCAINRICKQDRKNYFYPDLPKAYQISQFDIPLCENGYLDVIVDESGATKRIGITRIHIEEDAGKLIHDDTFAGSLVDFNRCGVPLIEIVSEPDIRSSAEAKAYLDTIKSILQYIDVSDCKMQEGSIRCDVNVSVRPIGQTEFGTRVEMKNVNSFSGAVRAIEYESKRQIKLLENGGTVTQETRRWDDPNGRNVLLRSKEDAHDYRYFPEPDLLTIVLEQEYIDKLKAELPELPNKKVKRYMQQYNLPHFDSNLLVENIHIDRFFEECIELGVSQLKPISNWLLGDVTRILKEKNIEITETSLTPKKLTDMVILIDKGTISNTAGKTVLEEIMFSDKLPEDVVKEKGLAQVSDTAVLEKLANDIIDANPKTVDDYKGGKTNVIGFLVGQCMRQSKGQGNPAILKDIIVKIIESK
ncbi:aspartyl/glutamyl-tRNA(Asn/Gln) amidotransferase subunit B [Hydrogenoanaerobacterium saccharovorans]|uniref:Aspartyl/glutamyl-tRNA(Asn/Gln) amidotransferase subunit B n=1 Tax=Hydrogenoanaerobacterium saccharovorans TaxID=474960 RepID=A0A1H7ZQM5_9FIRM|nr:Asp-tRNA(Asn)/Glu-tRNA(Gln) amidotransferase subunit GatB [Hydrogenoanaerobacterium saccharovorans]RPF48478.1 aspartyl/glutamyl-tRNA(Asn/Gln) amidotransferase subunit B [Hydrogenoanaerobacterium saccharovorans]SEM60134.1 aspartyl/glutamyl-tRNA(Asn/Gln) amidotransferase subunit B [Hydrogenoanaerobacterium saccharovorans]